MYVLSNGGNIYAIGKKIRTNSSVKTENVNVSKYKEMDKYDNYGTVVQKCVLCKQLKAMPSESIACNQCKETLMGSGTDNIEEFLERNERKMFTPKELGEFYIQASAENAEIWACTATSPWFKNAYGPNLMCYPDQWEVRVPKEWYDDIPSDGILCWATNENRTIPVIITNYKHSDKRPFKGGPLEYETAVPISPEECYQQPKE